MGKLEEFTRTSPEFAKAREGIEALAGVARREWRRNGKTGCYRILTSPDMELDYWEAKGGYRIKDSIWGRFVGTANKYLPWMMKEKVVPAWLKPPEVMFEIEKGWRIEAVKYAQAAVGAYPIKMMDRCEPAHDVYVACDDLILAETYSYDDVPIEEIKKIYIDPKSPVRPKAEAFAKRHKIPIKYGFPDPEIDEEQEEWYKKQYPPKEAEKRIKSWRELLRKERKEPLLNLINYLKKRKWECHDIHKPPRDVVAAALAEAYDKEMHRQTPVGASDALVTMIELGKREPLLAPVFGVGHPREACLMASSSSCPEHRSGRGLSESQEEWVVGRWGRTRIEKAKRRGLV